MDELLLSHIRVKLFKLLPGRHLSLRRRDLEAKLTENLHPTSIFFAKIYDLSEVRLSWLRFNLHMLRNKHYNF